MNQPHSIATQHDTLFEHGYPIDAPDLRRLYENAKRDQWNAAKDIDWNQPFDPADGVLADDLIDIYNTPHWDRLTREERAEFNRRFANWRLGVLLYGEHGAMLVCSQLVESVSGSDAKLFQATQVMDEARHNGGAGPLRRPAAGRPALSAARLREGAVRHDAGRAALDDQDHRAAAGGRDLRGGAVPDAGRELEGSAAPPDLPVHPAGRVPPHGLRHAEPARRGGPR